MGQYKHGVSHTSSEAIIQLAKKTNEFKIRIRLYSIPTLTLGSNE